MIEEKKETIKALAILKKYCEHVYSEENDVETCEKCFLSWLCEGNSLHLLDLHDDDHNSMEAAVYYDDELIDAIKSCKEDFNDKLAKHQDMLMSIYKYKTHDNLKVSTQ